MTTFSQGQAAAGSQATAPEPINASHYFRDRSAEAVGQRSSTHGLDVHAAAARAAAAIRAAGFTSGASVPKQTLMTGTHARTGAQQPSRPGMPTRQLSPIRPVAPRGVLPTSGLTGSARVPLARSAGSLSAPGATVITTVRPASKVGASESPRKEVPLMVLLRRHVGDELRRQRLIQGRTLRQVSAAARVSLGYLSEVERGQKEPSSELLQSICEALDLPLSQLLRGVADDIATHEQAASLAAGRSELSRADLDRAGLSRADLDRAVLGRHTGVVVAA